MTTIVTPVFTETKAHKELREQLAKEVETFLEEGGVVTIVGPGITSLTKVVEIFTEAGDKISKTVDKNTRVFALYDRSLLKTDEEDPDDGQL